MLNISTTEIDIIKGDWHFIGDMFDLLCGANLSNGQSRWVYNCQFDKSVVIKIERPDEKNGFQFDNVHEWSVWNNIIGEKSKLKEYQKFLAPCIRISACGRLLIQAKTTPITEKELPKLVPYWMADTKIQNWGRLGKRVVCHDYANHRFYSNTRPNKLVKPEWF